MNLNSLTPNLMVDNMRKSLSFYRDILGFKLLLSVPQQAPYDWCLLQHGDVTVMLQTRRSLTKEHPEMVDKPAGGALTLHFKIQGLAEYFERICDQVRVIRTPEKTSYGSREFSVADNSGFILTFAEAVEEPVVNR